LTKALNRFFCDLIRPIKKSVVILQVKFDHLKFKFIFFNETRDLIPWKRLSNPASVHFYHSQIFISFFITFPLKSRSIVCKEPSVFNAWPRLCTPVSWISSHLSQFKHFEARKISTHQESVLNFARGSAFSRPCQVHIVPYFQSLSIYSHKLITNLFAYCSNLSSTVRRDWRVLNIWLSPPSPLSETLLHLQFNCQLVWN